MEGEVTVVKQVKMKKKYYLIYKPYKVLSQFTDEGTGHRTLATLFSFPKQVYPVGRLDLDSEGLLLLTNDTKINHHLLNPKQEHPRSYWVQVEGVPDQKALQKLRQGVDIRIRKKVHRTHPAKVRLLKEAPKVPDRDPPIRYRKAIPTTWIELTLTEGKNRQVRRMTAAIGFPTLRLIRSKIANLAIQDMQVGEVRELSEEEMKRYLY